MKSLQGDAIVLHGPPKIGKTQLASHFPGPVQFLATEPGHRYIPKVQRDRLVALKPGEGWDTFVGYVTHNLASQSPHPKTVVVDTISGLYDLRPLLKTSINEDVRLSPEEAELESPLFAEPPAGTTFVAAVGAEESSEFHRQSRELATAWAVGGVTTDYVEIEGTNHFTIVDALTAQGSPMTERIAEMAETVVRS